MGCIFCRSEKNLTDEHVFPAFMGGRLEVRRASCDKCNRIFGVAEAAIKDATTPLLNLLRIKNRYGKVPNAPLRAEIRRTQLGGLVGIQELVELCGLAARRFSTCESGIEQSLPGYLLFNVFRCGTAVEAPEHNNC
jgi:hypothetical protein